MLFPKKKIEWAVSAAHSADFLNQRCQPFLSVEEGILDENGVFIAKKRRNGDEADYGFWVTPDVGVVECGWIRLFETCCTGVPTLALHKMY